MIALREGVATIKSQEDDPRMPAILEDDAWSTWLGRRRGNTSDGQGRAEDHGRRELANSAGTEEAETAQALNGKCCVERNEGETGDVLLRRVGVYRKARNGSGAGGRIEASASGHSTEGRVRKPAAHRQSRQSDNMVILMLWRSRALYDTYRAWREANGDVKSFADATTSGLSTRFFDIMSV